MEGGAMNICLRVLKETKWILSFQRVYLKFIEYFPDDLSALSRTLLRYFWTTFVETAVWAAILFLVELERSVLGFQVLGFRVLGFQDLGFQVLGLSFLDTPNSINIQSSSKPWRFIAYLLWDVLKDTSFSIFASSNHPCFSLYCYLVMQTITPIQCLNFWKI